MAGIKENIQTFHPEGLELKKHFLIMGNGYSGSSLLQTLLNAHTELDVQYEYFVWEDQEINPWKELWKTNSKESKKTWGNKIPYEQFLWGGWKNEDIISLINDFFIIWNVRKFSAYHNSITKRCNKGTITIKSKRYWIQAQKTYWIMREKYPDKIIQNSFEDMVIAPERELRRICSFLDVSYQEQMIDGSNNISSYPQGPILKEKAFD